MKKKELINLRSKDVNDLRKLVHDKTLEVAKIKVGILGGKEKNLKLSKNTRRDLAQILAIIREKEIIEKLKK